jgi:hypothetical protein
MRERDHPTFSFRFGGEFLARNGTLLLSRRAFAGSGNSEALHRLYRPSDALEGRAELPYRLHDVERSSSGLLPSDTIPLELEHGRFHFGLY